MHADNAHAKAMIFVLPDVVCITHVIVGGEKNIVDLIPSQAARKGANTWVAVVADAAGALATFAGSDSQDASQAETQPLVAFSRLYVPTERLSSSSLDIYLSPCTWSQQALHTLGFVLCHAAVRMCRALDVLGVKYKTVKAGPGDRVILPSGAEHQVGKDGQVLSDSNARC